MVHPILLMPLNSEWSSKNLQRALEAYVGPSGRVSEVLCRKRPVSLRVVKRLHEGLRIPYESLLAGVV